MFYSMFEIFVFGRFSGCPGKPKQKGAGKFWSGVAGVAAYLDDL
jgi:hypothetical protein